MKDIYSNETHNTSAVNASNVTQSTVLGFPVYLHEPLGATVFQITLWSTIVFLGVIGNLLVCIAILGRPKMKTSMNFYLLSLAIADLGVLLIMYPVAVLKYLSPFRWLLGKQACLYMIPTEEIFFGASTWSITAIAIERYRNVVGKKRYQIRYRSRDRVRTLLVIGTVWLASFLVSSVPLYPIMTYEPTLEICYPDWPDMSGTNAFYMAHTVTLIVFCYALPLAVIAFTYMKIKKQVRESVKFRNSMSVTDDMSEKLTSLSFKNKEKRDKRIWRQSNKARRILTPLVVLFAVTMFPLNTLRILMLTMPGFWTKSYYNLIVGQIGLFVIINSSANPLVYYLTSNEFKDAFKKIVESLRDKKFFKDISSKITLRALQGLCHMKVLKEENHQLTNNTNNNSPVDRINLQFVSGL
ncbi:neuromedin-U receptor 2-like [Oculina patagonica]